MPLSPVFLTLDRVLPSFHLLSSFLMPFMSFLLTFVSFCPLPHLIYPHSQWSPRTHATCSALIVTVFCVLGPAFIYMPPSFYFTSPKKVFEPKESGRQRGKNDKSSNSHTGRPSTAESCRRLLLRVFHVCVRVCHSACPVQLLLAQQPAQTPFFWQWCTHTGSPSYPTLTVPIRRWHKCIFSLPEIAFTGRIMGCKIIAEVFDRTDEVDANVWVVVIQKPPVVDGDK